MIRNFEEYTAELSEDEAKYIMPRLQMLLTLAIGKERAITNKQIVREINTLNPLTKPDEKDPGLSWNVKTSEPRIRHMIHILRVSDAVPFLVATSHGYYISNDKQEIEEYMGSVDDRLRSIYQIRRALKRQMKEWGRQPDGIQKPISFPDSPPRPLSFANGELNF
jgi:hypothetical protein